MTDLLTGSADARQTAEWGNFLVEIGWTTEIIDGVYVFVRKTSFFGFSLIKIQHPKGPLPLTKIDILARRRHALFTIIEPHQVGYDETLLKRQGYRISKMRYAHSATILIDLHRSETELWKSFSENAKRNIKKAEKNVRIERIDLGKEADDSVLRAFYALYTELGRRKRFYVPSYHETRAKIHAFQHTSAIFWAYEKHKKEPIAVLWVGSVEKTVVYFHPGNTPRGYDLLANYLLVWEAMKWGMQKRMKYFDFETAYDPRYPFENKAWQGYTEFKKKFGGEFIQFPPSYIKFYNPFMKWLYLFATMFSK